MASRSARLSRQVLAVLLVGGLFVVAAWLLAWAMNPEESRGFTVRTEDEQVTASEPAAAEPGDPVTGAADAGTPAPTPTPTPTGPPPEELIAAAGPPSATTVQVLDAGGGGSRTSVAVEVLEDLGYNVVSVTSARARVTTTTVWFTEDYEAEAQAMRARENRVAEVAPNQGLSDGVNLHVLVGPDWDS